ncbi:MAG: helix-turn-helix transcriptional regulator [Verrucomicrobia bacterium]|nr:helix-turn-helix transcriptional regulator [Verrucomicrobiota bacterium]
MEASYGAIGESPVPKVQISNRIRELRFTAGELTQQALADRVGITRQTVIALEQGKYYPSLELAFVIAEAFGVGIEDVFQPQINSRPSKRSGRAS